MKLQPHKGPRLIVVLDWNGTASLVTASTHGANRRSATMTLHE